MSKKKSTSFVACGKRKSAIARATIKPGTGIVKVNGIALEVYAPEFAKMTIQTPLVLAEDTAKKFDINVRINGGGVISGAEATALAIAKALVEKNDKLESVFAEYDKQLITADVRQRESRKPNTHGKARSKRQKSYR